MSTPKFYFFDVGVANYLSKRKINTLQGFDAGNSFEHFIFMELIAYIRINNLNSKINYWRSKSGLEVDFVIDGQIAIEVKLADDPKPKDLKGLFAFCDDYQPNFSIVVCKSDKPRLVQHNDNMQYYILPWQYFLEQLWDGKYF